MIPKEISPLTCPPYMHNLVSRLLSATGFVFPCSRRVFFFVFSFKQVKRRVPSPGIYSVMGKKLEQKSYRVSNSERKKKNIHKLIEMSQELIDLHNNRPTKNRNTSPPGCRGSACPVFYILPISASSLLRLQCQGKELLTTRTD